MIYFQRQLFSIHKEIERLRELRRVDYLAAFSSESDRDEWQKAEMELADSALSMLQLLKKQQHIVETAVDDSIKRGASND
jgi:hypothetical protein